MSVIPVRSSMSDKQAGELSVLAAGGKPVDNSSASVPAAVARDGAAHDKEQREAAHAVDKAPPKEGVDSGGVPERPPLPSDESDYGIADTDMAAPDGSKEHAKRGADEQGTEQKVKRLRIGSPSVSSLPAKADGKALELIDEELSPRVSKKTVSVELALIAATESDALKQSVGPHEQAVIKTLSSGHEIFVTEETDTDRNIVLYTLSHVGADGGVTKSRTVSMTPLTAGDDLSNAEFERAVGFLQAPATQAGLGDTILPSIRHLRASGCSFLLSLSVDEMTGYLGKSSNQCYKKEMVKLDNINADDQKLLLHHLTLKQLNILESLQLKRLQSKALDTWSFISLMSSGGLLGEGVMEAVVRSIENVRDEAAVGSRLTRMRNRARQFIAFLASVVHLKQNFILPIMHHDDFFTATALQDLKLEDCTYELACRNTLRAVDCVARNESLMVSKEGKVKTRDDYVSEDLSLDKGASEVEKKKDEVAPKPDEAVSSENRLDSQKIEEKKKEKDTKDNNGGEVAPQGEEKDKKKKKSSSAQSVKRQAEAASAQEEKKEVEGSAPPQEKKKEDEGVPAEGTQRSLFVDLSDDDEDKEHSGSVAPRARAPEGSKELPVSLREFDFFTMPYSGGSKDSVSQSFHDLHQLRGKVHVEEKRTAGLVQIAKQDQQRLTAVIAAGGPSGLKAQEQYDAETEQIMRLERAEGALSRLRESCVLPVVLMKAAPADADSEEDEKLGSTYGVMLPTYYMSSVGALISAMESLSGEDVASAGLHGAVKFIKQSVSLVFKEGDVTSKVAADIIHMTHHHLFGGYNKDLKDPEFTAARNVSMTLFFRSVGLGGVSLRDKYGSFDDSTKCVHCPIDGLWKKLWYDDCWTPEMLPIVSAVYGVPIVILRHATAEIKGDKEFVVEIAELSSGVPAIYLPEVGTNDFTNEGQLRECWPCAALVRYCKGRLFGGVHWLSAADSQTLLNKPGVDLAWIEKREPLATYLKKWKECNPRPPVAEENLVSDEEEEVVNEAAGIKVPAGNDESFIVDEPEDNEEADPSFSGEE